jgi:TPR repeat protein
MRRTLSKLLFAATTWFCGAPVVHAKAGPPELQVQCDQGTAAACGLLGGLYLVGAGVSVDMAKAIVLIRKGCDGGDVNSCTDLGALYMSGTGIPQDGAVSASLFGAACDKDWPSACHYLAVQHLLGNGVPRDLGRAAELNQKACTAGLAGACGHLAGMYRLGYGLNQDLSRATDHREMACKGGEMFSCSQFGKALARGEGRDKNLAAAAEVLLGACRGNEPSGCFELGLLVKTGVVPAQYGTDPEPMFVRAMDLALQPCQAGDSNACIVAKDIIRESGTPEEYQQFCSDLGPAVSAGCNEGVFTACVDLVKLHEEGCGVEKAGTDANTAKRQACALGVSSMCGS